MRCHVVAAATAAVVVTGLSATGCTGAHPAGAPRAATAPPQAVGSPPPLPASQPAAASPRSTTTLSATPVASTTRAEPAGPPVTVSVVAGVSRLTVTLTHRVIAAGASEPVTVADASSSGFANGLWVDYGDGTRYAEPPVAGMCPARPTPSASPAPASTRTWHLHHAYPRAGRFRVTVVAQTMGECSLTAPDEGMRAVARVDVG